MSGNALLAKEDSISEINDQVLGFLLEEEDAVVKLSEDQTKLYLKADHIVVKKMGCF